MQKLDYIINALVERKGKELLLAFCEEEIHFTPDRVFKHEVLEGFNKRERTLVVYDCDGKEFFRISARCFEVPTEEDLKLLMKQRKDTVAGYAWKLMSAPGGAADFLSIQSFTVGDIYCVKKKTSLSNVTWQDCWRVCAQLLSNPIKVML